MGIRAADRVGAGLVKNLEARAAFGESKHVDKVADREDGGHRVADKIYSYKTMETYKSDVMAFSRWVYETHGCKSAVKAEQYVREYLERPELSPHTQACYACALSKAYGVNVAKKYEVDMKIRHRVGITRSRGAHGDRARDKNFSESRNAELVNFCKHTGLRRNELEHLRGTDLRELNGQFYVYVERGKGGKSRVVPILKNDAAVISRCRLAGDGLVWGKVHTCADIHSYRAEYAHSWYKALARPLDEVPRSERYYCRGELAGYVYDKAAMLAVSQMLGHNRICVIAESYLRP